MDQLENSGWCLQSFVQALDNPDFRQMDVMLQYLGIGRFDFVEK
jgi:hypothetical protein